MLQFIQKIKSPNVTLNNRRQNLASPLLRYHRNRNYRCSMAPLSKNFSSPTHLFFEQHFHFSWSPITLVKQSWRMHVTVSSFAHCREGTATGHTFTTEPYRCHLHVQTSHLRTCDMKCGVAVGPMALDTCAGTAPSAHAACQASASRRYSLQAIDWFEKHMVRKADFWDPQCTCNMSPTTVTGLLKCTTSVWTKAAVNRP